MQLRAYQRQSIDMLYQWFYDNPHGNPVLSLPTGSGKSVIIGTLVHEAISQYPETRILMLTSKKELIEQNADKLYAIWPDAPIGIYSAGIGRKELDRPITFAGIQSIIKRCDDLGHVDLIIVDECDEISHKDEGNYRNLIKQMMTINHHLRVIGLSATPFRLGHGYIHEGEGTLFTAMIEPTSIEQLVADKYLSPLRSKHMLNEIDTTGVHIRQGDYIASELEEAAMKQTAQIVAEINTRAAYCQSILVFASGIAHAEQLAQALNGVCITGATPKSVREQSFNDYKNGILRVLTGVDVFSVGFDAPNTDCLVFARPTMSPRIYMQQAGRGMRLKSHTDHCLVLDFAGLVKQHGPITCVIPPSKKGTKKGEIPVKVCPNCDELIQISIMICPACGHIFEDAPKPKPKLHTDDIMGREPLEMAIHTWSWFKHTAQSGKDMLKVKYYADNIGMEIVTEYLPVTHDGFAGDRARGMLAKIANDAQADSLSDNLEEVAEAMNKSRSPSLIKYKKNGKFFEVLSREWVNNDNQ